jgi:Zn-dependent alcohol dehydrogenase
VLVRLHASGVCHSDENAIDDTSPTPCSAVLGPEGAGVVKAIGSSVTRARPGDHVMAERGRRARGRTAFG